jgi:hypothetical protein
VDIASPRSIYRMPALVPVAEEEGAQALKELIVMTHRSRFLHPAITGVALASVAAAAMIGPLSVTASSVCSVHSRCNSNLGKLASQRATQNPLIAYTFEGSVYVIRSDGSGRHRVTTRENASQPALSPGGTYIAFLAGPPGYRDNLPVTSVRVARVAGPPKAGFVVQSGKDILGSPVWSPDGRHLAFTYGLSIGVWNRINGHARLVLFGSHALSFDHPVWSADSETVAGSGVNWQSGVPQARLGIGVANLGDGTRRTEFIEFPSWFPDKDDHYLRGSAPGLLIGLNLDGALLVSSTFLGEGGAINGLWRGPAGGGKAVLVVGIVKNHKLLATGPFADATTALLSPNGFHILVNPGNRVWVGSSTGSGGKFVNLHVRAPFVVSQISWEGNHKLAFNRIRMEQGDLVLRYLMKLSSFSFSTGHTKPLAHLWDIGQGGLEIADPIRCLACGM